MPTPRQLISETLAVLGSSIIGHQCKLKQLQIRRFHLLDRLIALDERDEHLRYLIKGLKDKADWEMRTQQTLLASERGPRPAAPREPGEEWRGDLDDRFPSSGVDS